MKRSASNKNKRYREAKREFASTLASIGFFASSTSESEAECSPAETSLPFFDALDGIPSDFNSSDADGISAAEANILNAGSPSSSDENFEADEMAPPKSTTEEDSCSARDDDTCASEIDFAGKDSPESDGPQSFVKKLANWAVVFFISLVALRALLLILRSHECFHDLPKDPRTILKTPRTTKQRSVAPGHYVHLGLRAGIEKYLKSADSRLLESDNIYVDVGIDGVPFASSGGHDGWPICGAIHAREKFKLFTVGVYHGPEKPYSANDFVADVVEEAKELSRNGILFNGKKYNIFVKNLCADAPAKSYILYIKGHTGYSSCPKCSIRGLYKMNTVCFLSGKKSAPIRPRTNASFRNKSDPDHHTGTPKWAEIENFDMIKNTVQDYMHSACLGVMRKLMKIFVSVKAATLGRLSKSQIEELSQMLVNISQFIPFEFARKCRSLKFLEYFKATEFRLILLYTGPILFKKILPDKMYEHFLLFHTAMRILASPIHHLSRNAEAKQYLTKFSDDFKDLYGESRVSYNVHVLKHLSEDALEHGPVDRFSCFKFENFYAKYKRLIRSGRGMLPQLARRIAEQNTILTDQITELDLNGICTQTHSDGPLLPGIFGTQFKMGQFNGVKFSISSPNNCIVVGNKIVLVENFVKQSNGKIAILGKQFLVENDFFVYPVPSSSVGEFLCKKLGKLRVWDSKLVRAKCLVIPYSGETFYVSKLLHHGD